MSPPESASERRTGLAVVGCGGISRAHLRAIDAEPRARLVAVADLDAERAREAARKHGAGRTCASWDELWSDPAVEAVDVCLPHHLHAPAAIAALEHGRHVLVEKPVANTVAEADQMIAAARAAGRVLMVGHMKRFSRTFGTMQRLVTGGAIGRPIACEAFWHGPREIMPKIPWVLKKAQGGGGPLMGFGTHYLDLLRWTLGEAAEVACFTTCGVVENSEVEDTAVLALRFRVGALGAVHFSWSRAVKAYDEHIRILGTGGEVLVRGEKELHLASETRFGDRKLRRLDLDAEAPDWPADPFSGQLAHFLDCIETGQAPLTDGPSGRATVELIEVAYRSAETGETLTIEERGEG